MIYNVVNRDFEPDKLFECLSNPLGSNLVNNDCYCLFHFGKRVKEFCHEPDGFKFKSLKSDYEFSDLISKKFNINVNFCNLEPVIDSICDFNSGKEFMKIDGFVEFIINSIINNMEKELHRKERYQNGKCFNF